MFLSHSFASRWQPPHLGLIRSFEQLTTSLQHQIVFISTSTFVRLKTLLFISINSCLFFLPFLPRSLHLPMEEHHLVFASLTRWSSQLIWVKPVPFCSSVEINFLPRVLSPFYISRSHLVFLIKSLLKISCCQNLGGLLVVVAVPLSMLKVLKSKEMILTVTSLMGCLLGVQGFPLQNRFKPLQEKTGEGYCAGASWVLLHWSKTTSCNVGTQITVLAVLFPGNPAVNKTDISHPSKMW